MAQTGALKKGAGLVELEGASGKHSYSVEEAESFTDFINKELIKDQDLKDYLPLQNQDELFSPAKLEDGIILIKLINRCVPDTIDERVVNKGKLNVFQRHENLTLVVKSAQGIGVSTVNVGESDLAEGRAHILLGFVWQTIKIGLTQKINLKMRPELVRLLQEGETLDQLQKLPAEELLMRWVNYQLKEAGYTKKQMTNFSSDVKDSEIYTILLNQISPEDKKCSKSPLQEPDPTTRAEKMLSEANKINCRKFVTPKDVVNGLTKLNFAFVANLFNEYPALAPIEESKYADLLNFDVEGAREERAFKFWIQSLDIDLSNYLSLFDAMEDGLVMLRVFDKIEPGIVDWKKVDQHPKMKIHKIVNTNYCVDIAKKLGFSVVNIGGEDIYNKEKKLILGIVWQQMRHNLLKLLKDLGGGKKISEEDIIAWANSKVPDHQIKSFKDKSLGNAVFLCELCHSISPKSVNPDMVKKDEPLSEQDCLMNARYAISCARKLGGAIFCLDLDITEVKPKMILAFVASLMILEKVRKV